MKREGEGASSRRVKIRAQRDVSRNNQRKTVPARERVAISAATLADSRADSGEPVRRFSPAFLRPRLAKTANGAHGGTRAADSSCTAKRATASLVMLILRIIKTRSRPYNPPSSSSSSSSSSPAAYESFRYRSQRRRSKSATAAMLIARPVVRRGTFRPRERFNPPPPKASRRTRVPARRPVRAAPRDKARARASSCIFVARRRWLAPPLRGMALSKGSLISA